MKIRKFLPKHLGSWWRSPRQSIARFAFDRDLDVKSDIKTKYGFEGDLVDIYANNKEHLVHKWHHYLPVYDRYFSRFRGKKFRFLEIGVAKGGSLQMWRRYFGENAIIYGIDIDKSCARFDGVAGKVRIGSQDDPLFLKSVLDEMGGVDVILDDGSHKMDHIKNSFQCLFPRMSNGGIYMVEDLHTAYWKSFGGGYKSRNNFFSFCSDMVDDMHHWYHSREFNHPHLANFCSAIHIHDSIAVFEKNKVYAPSHSQVGL